MSAPERRGREPAQRPGRSRQDFETPAVFVAAVERRFGVIRVDLAASSSSARAPSNAKGARFVTPEEDSLSPGCDWAAILDRQGPGALGWLNPPFARIAPWAEKCKVQGIACRDYSRGAAIALLVPASVGSDWFRDHVYGNSLVLFLNGRLTFVGETSPYPKDCMLCLFGSYYIFGCDVWSWRGFRGRS